ncbi:hypothetical protein D6C78_10716, partial [Aureobasidium pullulans]
SYYDYYNHHYDKDFDPGNYIDDTLLNVTKDFELNINDIVTNALRRKSNSPIDTLEQFSALDAEDFATKVADYYRAKEAIDDVLDEVRALEEEVSYTRATARRRDIRLEECKKIIT